MPYSVPGVVAPPSPTAAPCSPRPGHRRSYTFAADDPANHGAFASLGALPRRARSPAQFHFRADEDDSSSDTSEDKLDHDDDDDGPPPPLRLRQAQPAFKLTPPTTYVRKRSPPLSVSVPFPRSSPVPSPTASAVHVNPANPAHVRPAGPGRTSSHPVVLLANGKPLKSSLKSSSSAPHMTAPPASHHLRARSAPSTPSLSSSVSSVSTSDAEDDEENPWDNLTPDSAPGTPKAVHFPAPSEGLETVLLFRRRARPAAVSLGSVMPGADDTETETETDRDAVVGMRWRSASLGAAHGQPADGFPFPRVVSPLRPLPTQIQQSKPWRYALDAPDVGARAPSRDCMIFLDSIELSQPSSAATAQNEITLHGTLRTRNAAFEKHVFVRFTLDGWATTSEVAARWVSSSSSSSAPEGEGKGEPGPGWDRFAWEIRLTDYAAASSSSAGSSRVGRGLEGRRLELVARVWMPWVAPGAVAPYLWADALASPESGDADRERAWLGTGGGGSGEWWDNNDGRNYVLGFRVVDDDDVSVEVRETTPAVRNERPSVDDALPAPTVFSPAPATNVIPFPTSSGSSEPAADAAPVSTSTSTSTPYRPSFSLSPSPPTPPPPQRSAHAQALAAKLGRLQLRNYAAPAATPVPGSRSGSPSEKEVKEKENEKETKKVGSGAGSPPAIYWPWGTSTSASPAPTPALVDAPAVVDAPSPAAVTPAPAPAVSASPAPAPAAVEDEDHDDQDQEDDASSIASSIAPTEDVVDTPPTSPLLLGTPNPNALFAASRPLPPSPPDSSSSFSAFHFDSPPSHAEEDEVEGEREEGMVTPPVGADASSRLYKAFLRQWCFAGGSGGVGGGGGGMQALKV